VQRSPTPFRLLLRVEASPLTHLHSNSFVRLPAHSCKLRSARRGWPRRQHQRRCGRCWHSKCILHAFHWAWNRSFRSQRVNVVMLQVGPPIVLRKGHCMLASSSSLLARTQHGLENLHRHCGVVVDGLPLCWPCCPRLLGRAPGAARPGCRIIEEVVQAARPARSTARPSACCATEAL